jgi:hypothetical protein
VLFVRCGFGGVPVCCLCVAVLVELLCVVCALRFWWSCCVLFVRCGFGGVPVCCLCVAVLVEFLCVVCALRFSLVIRY